MRRNINVLCVLLCPKHNQLLSDTSKLFMKDSSSLVFVHMVLVISPILSNTKSLVTSIRRHGKAATQRVQMIRSSLVPSVEDHLL